MPRALESRAQTPEPWIGLVEFKPLNQKTYGAAGAFTTIVTWAVDVASFKAKCEIIAATLDMFVADIDNAEPLTRRTEKVTLSEETEDMVFRAEGNPNAIVYGTFHRYPFDEA